MQTLSRGVPKAVFAFITKMTISSLVVVLALVGSASVKAAAASGDHEVEHRRLSEIPSIPVYSTSEQTTSPVARKQLHDMQQTLSTDKLLLSPVSLSVKEQRSFVDSACGSTAASRFDELEEENELEMVGELFKWCALASFSQPAAAWLQTSSPLLVRPQDGLAEALTNSVVVLAEPKFFEKSIQGTFIVLMKEHQHVARKMLELLVDRPVTTLQASPLLIPKTFYALIEKELSTDGPIRPGSYKDWKVLEQTCQMDSLRHVPGQVLGDNELIHSCPMNSGFCCSVQDITQQSTIMMSRYPIWPAQRIFHNKLAPTFIGEADPSVLTEDELPYIATIREEYQSYPEDLQWTPGFYEMLLAEDCLPSDEACSKCLRDKKGANCSTCGKVCKCYCKKLCHEYPKPKHVSKHIIVTPPRYARDSSRIIPRIVHQTWFEELDPEHYPNMSRLVESFKNSGWEYKFYTDETAAAFLKTHFPPEVLEAYETLLPGAFKADLFRYCVLLIHGGVYSDVDLHLESNLDFSIPSDVGFMVPIDEPGKPVDRQMCLWNGFIAAAPGHPILAKAIETVVNRVRNRFTSVDTDATFCPDPELSVLHAYDTLFTAGPCLLGATVNQVYGRHGQHSHTPGEINPWLNENETQLAISGTSFVLGYNEGESTFVDPTRKNLHHRRLPGRTVILRQNKWDMGAHRFTLLEQNLVISATDLPDSNDRENIDEGSSGDKPRKTEHYSKTHAKTGVYGLEHLYVDMNRANEDVHFFVDNEYQFQQVLEPRVA